MLCYRINPNPIFKAFVVLIVNPFNANRYKLFFNLNEAEAYFKNGENIIIRVIEYRLVFFILERWRSESEEVRDGAEHQNGLDETDISAPAAASKNVATPSGHRSHVSRLRRQHQLRGQRGHAPASVFAVRPDPKHFDELGPADAKAQRFCFCRIRNSRSRAISVRTGK